ncbi:MAG TPA: chromate efflux transporter [Ignavibacteriaceae bacterium]
MRANLNFIFILKSFLKIGLTSFGGHAALISVLQEELVKKKKVISDEMILEGLSIASLLPGPLAVNVVAYIGYQLRGWYGAISSITVVLLPSTALIVIIAKLYGVYGNLEPVNAFLSGVIPVIIALILSLCYNMFTKHISKTWQYISCGVILISEFFLNSYLWIVIFIAIGGITGYFFCEKPEGQTGVEVVKEKNEYGRKHLFYGLIFFATIFIALYFWLNGINHQLLFEFAKVSLTLFGGGYVMIPILHEIVVNNFHWLSPVEFANAIAFGQITPGPILVSATYVGFVTGGILGASFATFGIFVPSAITMIFVGKIFANIKGHPLVDGIMRGIRPVIIALIAYSGYILFKSLDHLLFSALITSSSFIIITYTKFNYFLLILIAGVAGLLFF